MSLKLLDCCVVLVAFLWLGRKYLHGRSTLKPPPGPKGYPLIGNLFDLKNPKLWIAAQEWGKKYGDIIHLESVGKHFIFINSYDVAMELCEKRALNYSDRPTSVMINELQRWDWLFMNLHYGDEWRKRRTPVQRFADQTNVKRYEDVQNNEAMKLLRRLHKDPRNYDVHIQTCMASYIMIMTYGHEIQSLNDQFVSLSKKGMKHLVMAIKSGGYLVDLIPWLKYLPRWFPGAGFHAVAEYGKRLANDLRYLPYFHAKKQFLAGSTIPSFLSHQIEERIQSNGEITIKDDELMSATCGICYSAGSDTTSLSILYFILAMTLYPEVQFRAQEEIDRFVGNSRLPNLADRAHLPYCVALCKEIQRWQPIVPGGIPHRSKEADIYAAFSIPAKSIIIPNQWAMLRDPKEYPEPEEFKPERYLPSNGGRIQRDPYKIAFGFGRRVCPGRNFADNAIFLTVVQILAVFSITKMKDENGVAVEPVVEFKVEGVIRLAERFDCSIEPRSPASAALIPAE